MPAKADKLGGININYRYKRNLGGSLHGNNYRWKRVHFVGNVPHEVFVSLMQLSTVHLYLTYPFVLSWSLLEAMSAGACIVASDTAPVREVIQNQETGMLVDFFDHEGIADAVAAMLDSEQERTALGSRARNLIQSTYDLRDICLPKQINWAELI